jgi:hypothetical protein
MVVLALHAPPSLWGGVRRTEGVLTPPLPLRLCKKMQKPRRRRQAARRCFLATLPAIERIFAPDFDGVHPQGVSVDSLGSFKSLGGLKVGETPVLRAFFERAASTIVLYVM